MKADKKVNYFTAYRKVSSGRFISERTTSIKSVGMETKLHFLELSHKCRFWLKDEFWLELEKIKRKRRLSWEQVEKEAGINYGSILNYKAQLSKSSKAQFISLPNLIKLADCVNLPHNDVEKMILKSKYGKNGKAINISYPINFLTPDFASLVGGLLAEGYISTDLGVGFWNTDKELLHKFEELAKSLLKEGVTVKENIFGCFMPAIFGHILNKGLDFSIGDKTKHNIGIPHIYLSTENKIIIKNLLSWLFTGDGWVTVFRDRKNQLHRTIGISFGSPQKDRISNLLMHTIRLLQFLEIYTTTPFQEHKETKTGRISYSWKISIKGKLNFIKFRESIGFKATRKQNTLDNAIDSFENIKVGNNKRFELAIKTVKEIKDAGGKINIHSFMNASKLSRGWSNRLLKILKEQDIIERVIDEDRLIGNCGGRISYTYKLTGK